MKILVSIFFALLIASSSAADDPTVDPCTLVARAEVEAIVGTLATNPKSHRIDRAALCEYEFTRRGVFLNVWVLPATGLERARKEYPQMAPVAELGPEAFINRNAKLEEVELFIRKRNATLQITLTLAAGVENQVKALGRKALERLP